MVWLKKKDKIQKNPNEFTSISKTILPIQQPSSGFTAEDIGLIVDVWLKEIYARTKTYYTSRRQVKAVTRVQSMADRYHVDCIKKYLTELRVSSLSLDGLTGKQLVEILRERLNTMVEEKSQSKGVERFFE